MLRVVFMGTPDFAVPCLEALCKSEHEVVAVFTQPDKPKNRGHKLLPTPVKEKALSYDIPVYQPISLRKGDDAEYAFDVLREINPDVIIVVAYGQILPESVLNLPKYGCINIHASLLPKYRGAAPIQYALLSGEKETGITSMQMEKGLDTGDMLISKSITIDENECCQQLHDRLSELGAEVLLETLDGVENDNLKPVKQDDSLSSYASMISKDMSRLDFSKNAQTIHNIIRAISGFAYLDGKRIKIYKSQVVSYHNSNSVCGQIADAQKLIVACGENTFIRILQLQSEGGKRLDADVFLRGNKISENSKFE